MSALTKILSDARAAVVAAEAEKQQREERELEQKGISLFRKLQIMFGYDAAREIILLGDGSKTHGKVPFDDGFDIEVIDACTDRLIVRKRGMPDDWTRHNFAYFKTPVEFVKAMEDLNREYEEWLAEEGKTIVPTVESAGPEITDVERKAIVWLSATIDAIRAGTVDSQWETLLIYSSARQAAVVYGSDEE